eukprot:GFUD01125752.1.p1 GENE.GFUD01125752.1~~GFUD01125752.1.p1  ORF type:complete len:333 (+),score=63.03 GFUD01125752.1:30-1028(+)
MSYLLKRDSTWFESVPLSDTSSVISLLSGDGYQVDVPAILLLATSPLVRAILSIDHTPPAYIHPIISLPSVAGDALLGLGAMLASGIASVSAEKKIEIIEAFKMLKIEVFLNDLQIQSASGTDLAQDFEQESVENRASTLEVDCNENILNIKSECLDSDAGIEDIEVYDSGQYVTNEIVKVEEGGLHSLKEETSMSEENVPKIHVESVCSLQNADSEFFCVMCPKKYNRIANLRRHIQSVHELKTFKCPLCEKNFTQNSSLKMHIQTVHEMRTFKCHLCDKNFSRNSGLKIHVQTVHEMKTVYCHVCGQNFRKDNLCRHNEAVHENYLMPSV